MKVGLIVMIDNSDELNDAYNVLTKKGFDVQKGELEEKKPKKLYMPTGAEMKAAMLELQETNGKDGLVSFLKSYGATSPKNLKKTEWPAAYAELNELNNTDDELEEEAEEDEFDLDDDGEDVEVDDFGDDMDDDDDMFGDDDDMEVPDPTEVKVACQKYAQKNGKEKATKILKANGLNTVRGLPNASDEALVAIMKAVSK